MMNDIKEEEIRNIPVSTLLKKYLNDGDVYIDVGANVGILATLVMKDIELQSYLFEPVKKYYEICADKFKDNSNVIVENIAISNDNTDKIMYVSNLNSGYNKIFVEGMDVHAHTIETVKCITFSNYAQQNNITRADFIKIDTEGHDVEVIEGMIEWLYTLNKLPYILFEGNWYPEKELKLVDKMNKLFGYTMEIPILNKPDRLLIPNK